jgi:hypothetical protein
MDFSTVAGHRRPGSRNPLERLAEPGWGAGDRIVARLLRKHSPEAETQETSTGRSTSEGAAMIAATALALVGIVVVGFLNRIP